MSEKHRPFYTGLNVLSIFTMPYELQHKLVRLILGESNNWPTLPHFVTIQPPLIADNSNKSSFKTLYPCWYWQPSGTVGRISSQTERCEGIQPGKIPRNDVFLLNLNSMDYISIQDNDMLSKLQTYIYVYVSVVELGCYYCIDIFSTTNLTSAPQHGLG